MFKCNFIILRLHTYRLSIVLTTLLMQYITPTGTETRISRSMSSPIYLLSNGDFEEAQRSAISVDSILYNVARTLRLPDCNSTFDQLHNDLMLMGIDSLE
jgi:hypothetical protein